MQQMLLTNDIPKDYKSDRSKQGKKASSGLAPVLCTREWLVADLATILTAVHHLLQPAQRVAVNSPWGAAPSLAAEPAPSATVAAESSGSGSGPGQQPPGNEAGDSSQWQRKGRKGKTRRGEKSNSNQESGKGISSSSPSPSPSPSQSPVASPSPSPSSDRRGLRERVQLQCLALVTTLAVHQPRLLDTYWQVCCILLGLWWVAFESV